MQWLMVLVFAVAPFCAAQNGASLVGRWRSIETSKGGIGAMYQFHADGTVDFSPGAVVEMPYRVEGDQLIFPPATTTGPEQKSAIAFVGDHQLRVTAGGGTEEYRRQGAVQDPANRLLGEWLTSRDMDGQRVSVRMFFYPTGKSLLLIAFLTQTGRYSVSNGRLVATFGGQPGLDGSFDVADGVLSINRSGGRVTKLARYSSPSILVDCASVTDRDNQHHKPPILKLANDAVIADPIPPQCSHELSYLTR